MIIDLVCKMEIDEEAASYSLNYDGKDYFFVRKGVWKNSRVARLIM